MAGYPRLRLVLSLMSGCSAFDAVFIALPEQDMLRYPTSDDLYLPSLHKDLLIVGGDDDGEGAHVLLCKARK
jgi:hypothetical protein